MQMPDLEKNMIVLFLILLLLNTLTEFLFYKKLLALGLLEEKNHLHHGICSGFRILWLLLATWLAIPIPLLFAGMFLTLILNIQPYQNLKLKLCNFSLVMHLIFVALLLTVIGVAGFLGMNMRYLHDHDIVRIMLVNITSLIFHIIGYVLIYCFPKFYWKEDFDRSKVVIYTWFLLFCALYQMLDSVIITLYEAEKVNDVLLLSGNILIVILTLNFMKYNYEFARCEEVRREYEESEILVARQYFEKEELKKLSCLDSLTKAYNRREISALMQENIQKGHGLVCVFVDLDGLKWINDTYGHTYGDIILKRFADASTEVLQEDGYLARIGGDEFLLIFLDMKATDVEKRMKELQVQLSETKEEKERILFSYGIAQGEDSVENYILHADQQMYLDKNRKRCGAV